MKQLQVNYPCGADQLAWHDVEKPEPKAQQVLVKVRAFALNRADILQRNGHYPAPMGESQVLGLEVCGDVVWLGQGVDLAWYGKRVMALVAGGGYSEYVVVEAALLQEVPKDWRDEQAAAFPEAALTVFQTVFMLGEYQPEQWALVHAGASGIGTMAIAMIKAVGGHVAVTVSSSEKAAFTQTLGADFSFAYQQQDWLSQLKAEAIAPNLILCPVGGDYLNANLSAIATDGKIIQIAMLKGRDAPCDLAKLLGKRVTLQGSTLRNQSLSYKAQLLSGLTQVFSGELLAQLRPIVDQVFHAGDVAMAHQYLESNANKGKIVCAF